MDSYRHSTLANASRRELGLRVRAGDRAGLQHHLASNVKVHHTWNPRKTIKDTDNGGVFNFDFSKDGSILGVACERKSVLLFDPFNGKLVASKQNAHTDCVNCVKFLDDRMFATCSDDTTVALWDVRYLKHTVQTFRGHSNWVKNIEYDAVGGKLVTSGFDGCIYTWDINRYSSENTSNRVFYTSGLMRSKLFPDASKLLISTHEGYIIIIHDLDLSTLAEDLKGFKPNMYRLMQRTKTPLRIGLMYNHVFEQKRNRVEFISDWPSGNDANIISSLQIHPQGWCVASRNTDATENTEWTCVHEIQNDYQEKKKAIPSWEVEAPHTSSSYCSSTNTPAYSSVAPSNQAHSTSTRRHDNTTQRSSPTSHSHSNSQRSSRGSNSSSIHSQPQGRNGGRNSTETVSQNQRRVFGQLRRERTRHSDDHPVPTAVPQVSHLATRQGTNAVAPPAPAAIQDEETPSSGRIHDALIQIRRGAQNDDGNFSLSISVHTASGRTLEFNQSDLESDEEDEDVVIEQIFSGADPDNERNSEMQRRYFSRLFQRTEVAGQSDRAAAPSTTAASFGTNSNLHTSQDDSDDDDDDEDEDDDNEDIDSDVDNGTESDIGVEENRNLQPAREDVDSETEDQEAEFDLSEESDNHEGPTVNQQLYQAAVGSHSAGLEHDILNDIQSAQMDLQNSNAIEVTNSVNNRTRTGVTRNEYDDDSDDSDDVNEDNEEENDSDTETSNAPVVSSSNGNVGDLAAQSASNTLMFLIQRNSGDRRRRLVNLRYMEGYTERENSQLQAEIHMNQNRLKGYIEECIVGRGFIKELAFSSDGRLISSPFGFGFRIFAFDSNCNEMCDCVPTTPVKLYEVTCSLAHVNSVVATKFSPTHNLIVSGCLDGKITFHQPVL